MNKRVYKHGINDMPRGWRTESEWNKKVYQKWSNVIERVFSEKLHAKFPTYCNCTIEKRWLRLSNFVEDFIKLDGYDEEKFLNGELCLDKDIKSNGQNKEYSLVNCMLVSNSDNSKQANKTRDYSSMKKQNNPNSKFIVARCDKFGNIIDVKWQFEYTRMGFDSSNISACCKHRRTYHGKDNDGNYYTWQYLKDVSEEKINKYIIKNKQVEVIRYEK